MANLSHENSSSEIVGQPQLKIAREAQAGQNSSSEIVGQPQRARSFWGGGRQNSSSEIVGQPQQDVEPPADAPEE